MRFKLDENLSRHLAPEIAALGHDVHTAGDEGLTGQPDEAVAKAAIEENRIVLTLDLDFGDERRFPPGRRPAFVVFRPGVYDIRFIRSQVLAFLQSIAFDDIEGATLIVEPGRIRSRFPEPEDDPRLGHADSWQEFPLPRNPPKDTP
jgi:predicted nuclease of predicted toxin-antitoxin system